MEEGGGVKDGEWRAIRSLENTQSPMCACGHERVQTTRPRPPAPSPFFFWFVCEPKRGLDEILTPPSKTPCKGSSVSDSSICSTSGRHLVFRSLCQRGAAQAVRAKAVPEPSAPPPLWHTFSPAPPKPPPTTQLPKTRELFQRFTDSKGFISDKSRYTAVKCCRGETQLVCACKNKESVKKKNYTKWRVAVKYKFY